MQEIKEMTKTECLNQNLEANYHEACHDEDFVSLVNQFNISKKEAMKITSRLQESIREKKNCKDCQGFFMCKNAYEGHFLFLVQKEERLYFSYYPCKYQKAILEQEKVRNRKVRMRDIDTSDKKQLKVIKWLDDFYELFDRVEEKKGLYLHGSFGSGKTFLLSALLNELSITKNIDTEILYFPEVLRSLKEDWDSFSQKMFYYQNVSLLLIDDIGAEKVSDWGRDEILGTILQYRMEKKKTTFFTSNLTIEELENHLSLSNNSVDKVKARRITERIKQLTIDLDLVSENRRK